MKVSAIMVVLNDFLKARLLSRKIGICIAVHKTDEFRIYGNDCKRFSGNFQVFKDGEPSTGVIPYFEARTYPCDGVSGGICDNVECDCFDDDDTDYDISPEDEAIENCGITNEGICIFAGTEHCDFECQFRDGGHPCL